MIGLEGFSVEFADHSERKINEFQVYCGSHWQPQYIIGAILLIVFRLCFAHPDFRPVVIIVRRGMISLSACLLFRFLKQRQSALQ